MPDTRPKKGVGGGGGIGTGKNPDEWTWGNLKFHHELLRALVHAPFTKLPDYFMIIILESFK